MTKVGLVQNHVSSFSDRYVQLGNHYVRLGNHYVRLGNHYAWLGNHYARLGNHCIRNEITVWELKTVMAVRL